MIEVNDNFKKKGFTKEQVQDFGIRKIYDLIKENGDMRIPISNYQANLKKLFFVYKLS